mgnify:CR=1 FL=1
MESDEELGCLTLVAKRLKTLDVPPELALKAMKAMREGRVALVIRGEFPSIIILPNETKENV